MSDARRRHDRGRCIDELLAEQQPAHRRRAFRATARAARRLPAQARYYRDLIPLDASRGRGEQYAFEVDLDHAPAARPASARVTR